METTHGGGGECLAKQYVQFTHVCTVINYVPSIDFCCCAVRQSDTLCCRYHQDWNHFRCVESDDVVETPTYVEQPTFTISLVSENIPHMH